MKKNIEMLLTELSGIQPIPNQIPLQKHEYLLYSICPTALTEHNTPIQKRCLGLWSLKVIVIVLTKTKYKATVKLHSACYCRIQKV